MTPSPLAVLASSAVLSFLCAAPHEQPVVLAALEGALARVEPALAARTMASVRERVEQARVLIETGELPKVAAARVEEQAWWWAEDGEGVPVF